MTSNRVRDRRDKLKISQHELGKRVGLTGQQIWRIESGRSAPTLRTAQALGVALGRSVDWLFPTTKAKASA